MRRGVVFTIILVSCLPILSATIISPSLPLIAQHFGGSELVTFKAKLLIALPGLFTAIGAPLAGWVIDIWGRKKILYIGLFIYALAGALPGLLLNTLFGILMGRIFVGLAVGVLFTVGTTLIADYFEGHKRHQVMGLQSSCIAFTAIISFSIGGALAETSWRLPFAVLALALLAIPLSNITLNDKIERHPAHASFPKLSWVWHHKALPVIYSVMCITLILFYFIPIEIPFILTQLSIKQQSSIGLILAVFNIAAGASSLLYARVKSTFSFQSIFSFAYVSMGLGFLWIAIARIYSDYTPLLSTLTGIICGLILVGLGFGLAIPNAMSWLQQETPAALRGRATSGLTLFLYLGQFLSPFAANLLNSISRKNAFIGPTFGTGSLFCFFLALFFLAFRYSNKLSRLCSQKA